MKVISVCYMQVKEVMMYWTSQDSPERYEKPQIVFLIVCIWYDIKIFI